MSSVRPQDDFYLYKNKEWLDHAQIPSDKPLTGAFIEILIHNEKVLLEDLANFAKNGVDLNVYNNELFNRFMTLYKKAINQKQRDFDGNGFIVDYVNKIEHVKSLADLEELTIAFNQEGLTTLLPLSVYTDMKNANVNTLYLSMPSIFLPDKKYYETNTPQGAQGQALIEKLKEVWGLLFDKVGLKNKDTHIENAIKFDNLLVPIFKSAEEQSDYIANYNPYQMSDLKSQIKTFDLERVLKDVVGKDVLQLIVTDKRYVEHFEELMKTDLEIIKSWLIVKALYRLSASGYATDELRVITASYSQILTGQSEITSFEKFTYQSLSNEFGDVVGLYFGHRYFGEKAKQDIENMVAEFILVYKKRLENASWLSKETREKAVVKLNKIKAMIGYPNKVHDIYLEFVPNEEETFTQNMIRFNKLSIKKHFETYQKEVDKELWGMGAHIVNAYYNPMSNLIVFPAGILQKPFYDYNSPKGANYGGIGAVIAHEITHAFDTNGAQIDENGNINNWWQESDFKAFNEKSEKMVTLFDGLDVPGSDAKSNGRLTVTENIADAGGLSCAYEAGSAHADFDPKDFFEGWAEIWRMKASKQYLELLANVDVHSPAYLRGLVQLKNFKPFVEYYGVKEGDGMYIDPKDYVVIW